MFRVDFCFCGRFGSGCARSFAIGGAVYMRFTFLSICRSITNRGIQGGDRNIEKYRREEKLVTSDLFDRG